ncbi:rhodanese-like domain-containing protein [Salipaludibacillus agaradhaerens]|uniref:Rhodanese-like domain-containing protein n=1 Tax=Salipaludibacillus agaradhaerens TaxID=76935 RepID=A0A9Q4B365_SALAG|nr:rhodanese-like domain-containing protein [Salipaludibacillus agaradhaerens]MCR6097152.1 rhodanese-like domain-containing protein [Salipaludibacillus agaradhaerens]MCR6113363.1 rhodanese-like domain-containing protein [Salipaludibacillus agaradhaerens]
MSLVINGLIILLFVWLLVRKIMPDKDVKQMTHDDLKKVMGDRKRQFVDVRTPDEYAGNHIKGFKNIPLHNLTTRLDELSKIKEIVLICQSGMRSNKASKILIKKGFAKVTNIQGGMASWKK